MAGEIQEADPRERRRARIVHRIGVAIFVSVLAAALAGLLGQGPLSNCSAQSSDGRLKVNYSRFIHYQEPIDLRIQIAAGAAPAGAIRLRFSTTFVDQCETDRIDPEPESSVGGPKYFTHLIRVETNAATEVKVRFAANHFGRMRYEIGLEDGPSLDLSHFAFP